MLLQPAWLSLQSDEVNCNNAVHCSVAHACQAAYCGQCTELRQTALQHHLQCRRKLLTVRLVAVAPQLRPP